MSKVAELKAAREEAENKHDSFDADDDINPKKTAAERETDEPVTVDLSEEDDDDAAEPADAAEPRKSRKERRAERGRQRERERNQFQEMYEAERAEKQRLLAHLERTAPVVQKTETPADDPKEQELSSIQAQLDALADRAVALGKSLTPEMEREFQEKARALRRREQETIADIAWAKRQRESGNGQGQAKSGRSMEADIEYHALRSQFPDVFAHSRPSADGPVYPALAWVGPHWAMKMAKAGLDPARHAMTPEGMKLRREAFRDAEVEFGLSDTRAPSEGQRRKYMGGGRGTGGGGDSTVHLSASDVRFGRAMYGKAFKGDEKGLMRHIAKKKLERAKKKAS